MKENESLRAHLKKILDWEDAHAGFDRAIDGFPAELCGIQPSKLPYSAWQILEHMRICQKDILEFCRNPKYVEPKAEEFWPKNPAPPTAEAWEKSVLSYKQDRELLRQLASDSSVDLFAAIPHGSGQTYLRELLLAADHNAYHTADLVAIRRLLSAWH